MADIMICKSCGGAFWADGGHQCGEALHETVDAVAKYHTDGLHRRREPARTPETPILLEKKDA